MTGEEDGIITASILRHATVFATQEEYWKYRGKAKTKNPDDDATYVCTMATFMEGQYWFDFDWAEIYRKDETDFDGIKTFLERKVTERKSTRTKRKRTTIKVYPFLIRADDRILTMRKATRKTKK